MDKQVFFELNMRALSRLNPGLCSGLSRARTTLNHYKFLETPQGEIVPALVDPSGRAHPLHSMMDPKREAKRLMDTLGDEGFLVLLGLGGGYYAEAALENENIQMVLAIDYDMDGIAELLCLRDYTGIFNDPRFHFIADPKDSEIEQYILNFYWPFLCGGIRTIPLRTRTAGDTGSFGKAASAIEGAIKKISADYSVQAYFGTRWFSNTIRNLKKAEHNHDPLAPVRHAAVTAAGPSLNLQIASLKKKRKELFLIAADTSLPCLLSEDLCPDAVVSIDCQHYSYYHFMAGLPESCFLFMDLAGSPLVASQSENLIFFSGKHPLTGYISRTWRPLPDLDISGGNVTYAAVSLAEKLGAETVELYGADFSYPMGLSYARGSYFFPLFEKQQNRLSSLEALFSSFLFRGPLVKKEKNEGWYYESPSLRTYRERLEDRCKNTDMAVLVQEGIGAPLQIELKNKRPVPQSNPGLFCSGRANMDSRDFLIQFQKKISQLPLPVKGSGVYIQSLEKEERLVFTALIPAGASIKRRRPELSLHDTIRETINYSLNEIDKVLDNN